MMKQIISLLFFLCTLTVQAQHDGYYNSYKDLMANNMVAIKTNLQKTGKVKFTFKTKDKELKKWLKEEACYVRYDDTLYINTENTFYEKKNMGKGYRKIFFVADNVFFFIAQNKQSSASNAISYGGMFGLVGGLLGAAISEATGGSLAADEACFLMTEIERNPILVDDTILELLLEGHGSLYDRYMSLKKRERRSVQVITEYLFKLNQRYEITNQ